MPDTAPSRKRQMRGNVLPPVRIDSGTPGRLHPAPIFRLDERVAAWQREPVLRLKMRESCALGRLMRSGRR